jgi:hypothetical protein
VGVLATQGNKRQFLTTMDPDVIRASKQKALDLDRTASDVMEEAARDWLERHKHKE